MNESSPTGVNHSRRGMEDQEPKTQQQRSHLEELAQQLKDEQAKLRTVIQSAPVGIIVTDEQARITLTNPAADIIYAYAIPYGEDFDSHAAMNLRHPDGRPYEARHLPLTRAALDGETQKNLEMIIIHPDGEKRDLLVDTTPIRNSSGEITGAIGVFRDITERKHIEKAAILYADRLKTLHEIDKVILSAQSAEEIAEIALPRLRALVPCRRASVELFDFEAGESITLAVDFNGATKLKKGHRTSLVKTGTLDKFRSGQVQVIEDLRTLSASSLVDPLQEEGLRSYASVPLRVHDELIGALNLGMTKKGPLTSEQMDVIHDIADQLAIGIRQAQLTEDVRRYADELEIMVEDRTAELRASEERFRTLFEQSAIGIAIADLDGYIIATNTALQEMLGYTEEELHGKTKADITHPDDVKVNSELHDELLRGERDAYKVEKRYIRKNGGTVWVRLVAFLVHGSSQEPQYAIGMVENITQQKRAQAAMIQSEKLAMTGQLAASLAHEVNNPLQTVIGCLGLAQESLTTDEKDELEQYIEISLEELRRAARIVGRLRDLGQPIDDTDPEPTDVNEVIDSVLKLTRKKLKNRHIKVIRKTEDDLPRANLMPDRIQQVFLNLVLNAIDAMPKGGRLQVSTRYDSGSDQVHVSFTDDGSGIPTDILPQVFNPFFSTKPEGMGLGLFVSRNIVEQHGGRIKVNSEVGEGCTFEVQLPIQAAGSQIKGEIKTNEG